MKKTELKEIIRKEVRKALNESDYDQAMQNLAKMADINLSKPQGLNKFSFDLPMYLPNSLGNIGLTKINTITDFKNWKDEFKSKFKEEPKIEKSKNPNALKNEWDVTNPVFKKRRELADKAVMQYGTKGD